VDVPVKRGRGRPASATREQVLALATERFLAGERIDVQSIARDLGLARTTVYRWFKDREALVGEVLATLTERGLASSRLETPGVGGLALLQALDRFSREIVRTRGLRALLSQERERALRLMNSTGGPVHARVVAAVERMIVSEVEAGDYSPPFAPRTLAYAIVCVTNAFLYDDAVSGIRGDTERLYEVEAALLGVSVE